MQRLSDWKGLSSLRRNACIHKYWQFFFSIIFCVAWHAMDYWWAASKNCKVLLQFHRWEIFLEKWLIPNLSSFLNKSQKTLWSGDRLFIMKELRILHKNYVSCIIDAALTYEAQSCNCTHFMCSFTCIMRHFRRTWAEHWKPESGYTAPHDKRCTANTASSQSLKTVSTNITRFLTGVPHFLHIL